MVHFVGAGCGAADLITVRGARLLREADVVVYAGSLVNPELLRDCKKGCELYNSAEMALEDIVAAIERAEGEGKTTVRLHSGDSSLYGAVREQFAALDERGIPYDVTPGVSAFSGAAASLRTEYTPAGGSQTVILTRMVGRTAVPEGEALRALAVHRASMVLYLSTGLAEAVQAQLLAGGYPPETPAAVVFKASWPDEKVLRCTVGTLCRTVEENHLTRTSLLIVGDCLGEGGSRSLLYHPSYERPFREAAT